MRRLCFAVTEKEGEERREKEEKRELDPSSLQVTVDSLSLSTLTLCVLYLSSSPLIRPLIQSIPPSFFSFRHLKQLPILRSGSSFPCFSCPSSFSRKVLLSSSHFISSTAMTKTSDLDFPSHTHLRNMQGMYETAMTKSSALDSSITAMAKTSALDSCSHPHLRNMQGMYEKRRNSFLPSFLFLPFSLFASLVFLSLPFCPSLLHALFLPFASLTFHSIVSSTGPQFMLH